MRKYFSTLAVAAMLVSSCGSSPGSQFQPQPEQDAGADAQGDSGPIYHLFGEGGPTCVNLQCKQVTCDAGTKTTLSGTVYDPAGKVPLYNVVVYVPNAPVDPITTGASCDHCGVVSGKPLVSTITDAAGHFSLENVPTGKDIPLVMQVGKWRRRITIPSVAECTDNVLSDPTVTRLPRNQSEGDMPQMAIVTGGADPFECLLTKMGVDLSEFTPDTGTGRVHYYHENGINTSPAAPTGASLYGDLNKMKSHDIVFLPCEGAPNLKSTQADQNLVDYTSVGGRAFTTHYGYVWLYNGAQPFPTTGTWQPEQSDRYSSTLPTTVNQGFPKGAAFAQWLVNVNASTTLGTMGIVEGRHDLNSAPNPPSTTWMTSTAEPAPNPNATVHITFNTPIGLPDDQQCGRVVYSDFHVSASALTGQPTFPASCKTGDLSPQEKALEFMLFDLSSCIQSDSRPPAPPIH